jgi:hypothetical protein
MTTSVIYFGDTSLHGAAAYLAGLMHAWGWSFDYVPSDQPAAAALFGTPRALFVLSDYPAARLAVPLQQQLLQQVSAGAGLLMIGGWESFHGCGGNWDGTPVAQALPVQISSGDDRLNCDHPVLVQQVAPHPAVDHLPWDTRPPLVGGLNRWTAKADSETLLEVQHFEARREAGVFAFRPTARNPLLVVGRHGAGRTAALATDVAPHWVGPLVDWGPSRVTAQAPGGEAIEVGNLYAQFLQQLLTWLAVPTPPSAVELTPPAADRLTPPPAGRLTPPPAGSSGRSASLES